MTDSVADDVVDKELAQQVRGQESRWGHLKLLAWGAPVAVLLAAILVLVLG